jgi:hypothetical protein
MPMLPRFLLLPLIFSLACGGGVGSFTFTEESGVIVIEGSPALLGPLTDLFPSTLPMEIDLEQELEEQDASGARSVHLTQIYFELTDDSDEPSFDFIDRISLEVSASDADLPRREIAWSDPVPAGVHRFFLGVDESVDLKPYAEAGLRLRTVASGSAPSQDARFRVYATFRVRVL